MRFNESEIPRLGGVTGTEVSSSPGNGARSIRASAEGDSRTWDLRVLRRRATPLRWTNQWHPQATSDRSSPIPSGLHEDVDHIPILVNRPPQVLRPALHPHEQLIEIPRISLAAPPPPQPSRILQLERQAPLADRLVRDVDAALGEEVLDVPKTEAEPVVQPHRVTDDFRRESGRWCADSARWASSGRHVDHRDRRRVMISM